MQQNKTYGLITSQNQVVKCQKCYSHYGYKQKFDFYICCLPFELSKILCQQHRAQCKCQQCDSIEANIDVDLSLLDEFFLKKIGPTQKTRQPENKTMILKNPNFAECCLCYRKIQYQTQTYLHSQCQKRCCYVCLYMIFFFQFKMFRETDKKLKSNYKIVMKCCDKQGESIEKLETCFSQNVCVFCGCSSNFCKSVIKLKNSLMFCIGCYYQQWNNEKFEGIVWELIELITQIQPKNCLYCEREIKMFVNMPFYQIKEFNEQLCVGCYPKKGKVFDQLKNYKPPLVEKNSNCFLCGQGVEKIQIKDKHADSKKQLNILKLVYWKDGKKYCGGCLYFKYQKLRKQFETKKLKKYLFSSDIHAFEAIKQSYQNHFMARCMVCSFPQKQCQKFAIVKKGEGKHKNKLSCWYCRCYGYIVKDIKKFKRLIDIKQEIHQREDPQDKNDKIIKTASEIKMSECLGGLFSRGSSKIVIRSKNVTKRFIQILLPPGDNEDQEQQAPKSRDVFQDPISQEEYLASQVKTAIIRTGRTDNTTCKETYEKTQIIDGSGYLELQEFGSFEEIKKRIQNQNTFRKEENTPMDFSYQIANSLLNTDLFKQIQNLKLSDVPNSMKCSLSRQQCKVFSCSNLTQVIHQSKKTLNRQIMTKTQDITRTTLKQQHSGPLMLGLMCSSCFARYLLGLLKEEEIDRKYWDKAIQQSALFTQKIQKIIN